MIQPNELKQELPMTVTNGVISTTTKVWDILVASKVGNLIAIKEMTNLCPELIYAQYNYTPPIHLAAREGHIALVDYLLENGAYDPAYSTYPFRDNLQTMAQDRGHNEIYVMLKEYSTNPALQKFKGDNGKIHFERSELQTEFEEAVDQNDLSKTEEILKKHPEFALDETFFWGEGILMMPAKENQRDLIDLLMKYEAKVPTILKWTQKYYFEHTDGANYMMEKGMDPNVMSWHHVTILHDMAQKGNIQKAELLIKYGDDINTIDDEYQSTPLGMAARWGQIEMVEYLISQGSGINKSGAAWATPLAWAKKKGHIKIERVLKDGGAQV